MRHAATRTGLRSGTARARVENAAKRSRPVCAMTTTSAVGSASRSASVPAGLGGRTCRSSAKRWARVSLGDASTRLREAFRAKQLTLGEHHRGLSRSTSVAHPADRGNRIRSTFPHDEHGTGAAVDQIEAGIGKQLGHDDARVLNPRRW